MHSSEFSEKPVLPLPIVKSFFASVLATASQPNEKYASSIKLLAKHYLDYLRVDHQANKHLAQSFVLKHLEVLGPHVKLEHIKEIFEDIKSGGEGHQLLVSDNSDLIEMLNDLQPQISTPPQVPDKSRLTTRRSSEENNSIIYEPAYCTFYKQQRRSSREFTYKPRQSTVDRLSALKSSEHFHFLPEAIQELVSTHHFQCLNLMENYSLTFEYLKVVSVQKMTLLLKYDNLIISEFKPRNILLGDLLYYDQSWLFLCFRNYQGLMILLDNGLKFSNLNLVGYENLELLFANYPLIQFLFRENIYLIKILIIEKTKFLALAEGLDRLVTLVSKICIEDILELPLEKLKKLLEATSSPEREQLENELTPQFQNAMY